METIPECEQFTSFSLFELSPNSDPKKISDSSLDVHIPSFPGSPRSITHIKYGSASSLESDQHQIQTNFIHLKRAIDLLQEDHELLIAAETGNYKALEEILKRGTNIQEMDTLGRNALHLAVCANSIPAITLLLEAGVNPNVMDNVGMTPLSLCLTRRPALRVAYLLFDYDAIITARTSPMDTGLFLQFVMMSTPTKEEAKILRLLLEKGATLNDPQAPGGRQALHFAAMSNNWKLIHLLVDLGADLFLKNHRGETPKEVALSFKCREAYLLLDNMEGRSVSEESSNGDSDEVGSTSGSVPTFVVLD